MLLKDNLNSEKSGVLMHLSSLPSAYGIGTLGKEAYRFIDFLKKSRQKYWQLLPLVPLGEENSPYKSSSCYAGEILYIDLDLLVKEGLLESFEIPDDPFRDGERISFQKVREFKLPLIKKATERFDTENQDYIRFIKDNSFWLKDFACFMAMLEHFNTDSILSIPLNLRKRNSKELEEFEDIAREKISFYTVSQYLFYSQYYSLRQYAIKNGILLIGDIPIYVSLDSAEVWTSPQNFVLNEDLTPKLVAGVPPDIFASKGQLWGNPIYDWENIRKSGYAWWKNRIKHCMQMYDIIRIDHFRAFADYFTIKYGAKDATVGKWLNGPAMDFWNCIKAEFNEIDIIAEDLGCYSRKVEELVEKTGFPNMKVLQFAFTGKPLNPHLPENFDGNCVCYTGTHDNDTTLGWYLSATENEREMADSLYPPTKSLPVPLNLIKAALSSNSKICIIPIQDWLMQPSEARMNIPGVPIGNWGYRIKKESLSPTLSKRIIKISRQ